MPIKNTKRQNKRGRVVAQAQRGRRQIVVETRAERLNDARARALGCEVSDTDAAASESTGTRGSKKQ